ncbi:MULTISPECIES: hypothetical protein [unclassified Enterococcus]|uniref:hypothetical protein n=1 Tax=unclassified Enterococcus TaxID=2608891 RepID=UPI001F14C93E|nr:MULTISPECIES: hypothetical protein [unclassified Enterococcus]
MKLGSYPNLNVVSGLNLAMLIEAALSPLTSSASLASHLETVGRNAVEKLVLAEETDEEEYEE